MYLVVPDREVRGETQQVVHGHQDQQSSPQKQAGAPDTLECTMSALQVDRLQHRPYTVIDWSAIPSHSLLMSGIRFMITLPGLALMPYNMIAKPPNSIRKSW